MHELAFDAHGSRVRWWETPGRQHVTIRDAGHVVMADAPEAFVDALVDALGDPAVPAA